MSMVVRVTKFTHFFKVSEPNTLVQEKLTEFVKSHLLETKLEYVDGRYRKTPGRVFAARTQDKREYRFHINCFDDFDVFFKLRGYQVEVEKDESIDVYPGDDVEFLKTDTREPRDYQLEAIDWIKSDGYSKVVELAMGKGKGLSKDTLIKVPDGWKKLEELNIGDRVLTPSREYANVTAVYDNENMDCYKVTFEDGRSCVCDIEHLWEISKGEGVTETMNMKEVIAAYGRNDHLFIPLIASENNTDTSSWRKVYKFSDIKTIDSFVEEGRAKGYLVFIDESKEEVKVVKPTAQRLLITEIEFVGKLPARCITVDHPSEMYVIQDYICTHNTFVSLKTISEIGKKVCIFVLGRYTDRWWDDVGNWAENDKILEIRGALELKDVLRNSDMPYIRDMKMFIMTITTFYDYCAEWENLSFDKREGMVPPERIWEVLGIGVRITDETHQHFHQNFLTDLYTHIPKAIYLSATLNPGDAFLAKMYETFLPKSARVGGGLQEKYTHVKGLMYRFREPSKIRCQNRKRMYNHTEFEKWLARNPKLLEAYFKMIDEIVQDDFVTIRKEGQKMLIFFATKKFCEMYAKRLRNLFPKLNSRKYVSEDKYDVLLTADIACSTLGSSGTAVDIPNLLRCLMTTALKSEQANLQALGRLRKIEDQTEFSYLVCTDIPKHLEYHDKKKRLFRDWVKSHGTYHTEKTLG